MRLTLITLLAITATLLFWVAYNLPHLPPAGDFDRPDLIVFGADVGELNDALADKCTLKRTRDIDPPFLNHVERSQTQVDCLGFPFFGKRRFAEFVFADGSLELVWILTNKEEEEAFRSAMSTSFGPPDQVSDNIEIFSPAGAALRKDKPEVAFFSESSARYVDGILAGSN